MFDNFFRYIITSPDFWPKSRFLSIFHSKNRKTDEYANDTKIEDADFKENKEDCEGREYWIDREELIEDIDEELIRYNYFLEKLLNEKDLYYKIFWYLNRNHFMPNLNRNYELN